MKEPVLAILPDICSHVWRICIWLNRRSMHISACYIPGKHSIHTACNTPSKLACTGNLGCGKHSSCMLSTFLEIQVQELVHEIPCDVPSLATMDVNSAVPSSFMFYHSWVPACNATQESCPYC